MNIETSGIKHTIETKSGKSNNTSTENENSVKFADELKEIKEKSSQKVEETNEPECKEEELAELDAEKETQQDSNEIEDKNLDKALKEINSMVENFNRTDDKLSGSIKENENLTDNSNVINKDFNIQENKELLPQMNPGMNFSGDGQPFSSFMNNDTDNKNNRNSNGILGASAQDLAEEASILSSMAENIAIANRNQLIKETLTVTNNTGTKKIDSQTGIKIESVVKYDSIIMNAADVEIFVNLVENGEVNLNNLAPKAAERSIHISKTLADMLAKSMENNQPLRIDFDNDISIIIRISRDGKISADFLPSSQIAEAYLKENLPLLRQRFDENDIKYNELNQRERRDQSKENHRKKDRNNE